VGTWCKIERNKECLEESGESFLPALHPLSILEGKMTAMFASTVGEENSNAQYTYESILHLPHGMHNPLELGSSPL
jgi:hypothetical protein